MFEADSLKTTLVREVEGGHVLLAAINGTRYVSLRVKVPSHDEAERAGLLAFAFRGRGGVPTTTVFPGFGAETCIDLGRARVRIAIDGTEARPPEDNDGLGQLIVQASGIAIRANYWEFTHGRGRTFSLTNGEVRRHPTFRTKSRDP